MIKVWSAESLVLLILCGMFFGMGLLGGEIRRGDQWTRAYQLGLEKGAEMERADQEARDEVLKKSGVCRWAQMLAGAPLCTYDIKTGEEE